MKGGDKLLYEVSDRGIVETLERDIYPVLTDRVQSVLGKLPREDIAGIEEIRLRADKPVMIFKNGQDLFINNDGRASHSNF
jgi:stage III sporulation protein AA